MKITIRPAVFVLSILTIFLFLSPFSVAKAQVVDVKFFHEVPCPGDKTIPVDQTTLCISGAAGEEGRTEEGLKTSCRKTHLKRSVHDRTDVICKQATPECGDPLLTKITNEIDTATYKESTVRETGRKVASVEARWKGMLEYTCAPRAVAVTPTPAASPSPAPSEDPFAEWRRIYNNYKNLAACISEISQAVPAAAEEIEKFCEEYGEAVENGWREAFQNIGK